LEEGRDMAGVWSCFNWWIFTLLGCYSYPRSCNISYNELSRKELKKIRIFEKEKNEVK